MRIDFLEDEDIFGTASEKEPCIIINGQDGRVTLKALQYEFEHLFASCLTVDLVRDVVVIRWDLYSDLPAWFQMIIEIRNQFGMILTPLQRGVAEDQVPVPCQCGLISLFKDQAWTSKGRSFLQHMQRRIESGHIA